MFFKKGGTKTLIVRSEGNEVYKVQEFITKSLKGSGVSDETILQLELVVEEIFINISKYAYVPPDFGDVEITCSWEKDVMRVTLTFVDAGPEFDPLKRPDPDTSIPAEERNEGGLGIFLVKNNVDGISYRREGGKNILTVEKNLP